MTRWRIIAETKSDICQGKYFKVSPKIFHWHLDISPGDQYTSLILDIIPGRQCHPALTDCRLLSKGGIILLPGPFPPSDRIFMFKDQFNVTARYYHCSENFCSISILIDGPNYQHQQYKEQHHYWLLLWLQITFISQIIRSARSTQHSANRAFYQMLSKIQSGEAITHCYTYMYLVFTYYIPSYQVFVAASLSRLSHVPSVDAGSAWRGQAGLASGRECGAWVTQLCAGSHRGETWPGHTEGDTHGVMAVITMITMWQGKRGKLCDDGPYLVMNHSYS